MNVIYDKSFIDRYLTKLNKRMSAIKDKKKIKMQFEYPTLIVGINYLN